MWSGTMVVTKEFAEGGPQVPGAEDESVVEPDTARAMWSRMAGSRELSRRDPPPHVSWFEKSLSGACAVYPFQSSQRRAERN